MLVVTEPKIIYELNRQSLMQKNAVIYNLNANVILIEGVEKKSFGIAIMNRLLRTCEYDYKEL